MIFLIVSMAMAQPSMISLEEGEQAPFSGRLLNDEAIASILANKEFSDGQCALEQSIEYSLKLAEKDLKIDYLEAEKQTLINRHDSLMEIKNDEIESLRKHVNPQRATFMFLGGFILGTTASLVTYYSVNKIVESQ